MKDEIRRLRRELGAMTRGRGRRYAVEVRQRIGAAALAARKEGTSWQAIGRALGIPHETVRRAAGAAGDRAGFVRVEVAETTGVRSLALVTPSGYRVEGLDVESSVEILRRLR